MMTVSCVRSAQHNLKKNQMQGTTTHHITQPSIAQLYYNNHTIPHRSTASSYPKSQETVLQPPHPHKTPHQTNTPPAISRLTRELAFLHDQVDAATTQSAALATAREEEQAAAEAREHQLRDQLVALNSQAALDVAARVEAKRDRKLALSVAWGLLGMVKDGLCEDGKVREAEAF